jgi:hypothetical protein
MPPHIGVYAKLLLNWHKQTGKTYELDRLTNISPQQETFSIIKIFALQHQMPFGILPNPHDF